MTVLEMTQRTHKGETGKPKSAILEEEKPENNTDTGSVTSGESDDGVTSQKSLPMGGRRKVFFLFCLLNVFVTYDSGAISASLSELQNKYELSKSEAGLIGSLVYLGLTAGSLVAGPALTHWQPKWVLVFSLLLNIVCAVAFAAANDSMMLLATRFLIGVSQAFIAIYAPVWVDEFSPKESCTLWMSLIQGGVPIGVMVGYVFSGYMTANGLEVCVPFYVQAVCLLPLTIALACVPVAYIDTRVSCSLRKEQYQHMPIKDVLQEVADSSVKQPPRVDVVTQENGKDVWLNVKALLRSQTFLYVTFGMCSLYFVVTGLQLWVTEYMVSVLHADKNAVVTAFALTCATGPIVGVLCGGLLLDRLGGYQGRQGVELACKMSFLMGIAAVGCSYAIIFVESFWWVVGLIWMLLFFGGAIVPAGTGIIMSSVPRPMRSFASSLSTMIYNLLGYFAGPTMVGILADLLGGTEWGFKIVVGWAITGPIMFAFAWHHAHQALLAHKNHRQPDERAEGGQAGAGSQSSFVDEDFSFAQMAYESARNRTTMFIVPISKGKTHANSTVVQFYGENAEPTSSGDIVTQYQEERGSVDSLDTLDQ
eukprot:comp11898_c0_seq1/m.6546 comp11898_c0_seq1/g.6546  ORF comp11898_c0_seq1/g.6546 comp11898_c0_seq1/m.6546 type:complete len:592 (-) comp11898_c0_seq1:164-1939(-)